MIGVIYLVSLFLADFALRCDCSWSSADAFQLTSFGFGNNEADKEESKNAKEPINGESKGIARGFDEGQESERDDEVRDARTESRSGNAAATYPQGEDLGDENPGDGAHAECEAGDVDHQAGGCDDAERRAED